VYQRLYSASWAGVVGLLNTNIIVFGMALS
jgi:hypothetical protein